MFNFFKKNNQSGSHQKLNLKLSGLHCTACAVNIDFTLEDLDGVINSKTNYAKSQAVIDFDSEKTDPQKIIAEIEKLDYRAEVI